MPIYEYECGACGHQVEAFQSIKEAPLVDCPDCHKPALGKLISSTSFQLKGTGWYVTDIRDKGKPKKEESGEKSAESSEKNASLAKPADGKMSTPTTNSSSE